MQGHLYTDLISLCEAADVSWALVNRPEQLWHDAQLLAGGLISTSLATSELTSTDAIRSSQVGIPGLPLEFGKERARCELKRQPPQTGEHTREVLLEVGIDDSIIESMLADNVIVCGS